MRRPICPPQTVPAILTLSVALAVLADAPGAPLHAAKSLADQVLIRRDTFGVPHILAESDEAAAFGLGYAQVEDHPEALARWLLSGRGQAAKYFGPEYLEDDVAAHRIGGAEEARAGLVTLDPQFRRMIRAFADGVNRHVATHREQLPAWMPTFTEADVLAGTRDDAAGGTRSIVRALTEKYTGGEPVPPPSRDVPGQADASGLADVLDVGGSTGSNALALSGSRTTSGKPILLGNPHLPWRTRYWEAHITVPRHLDFYGSTLIGYPWLRAGFNAHLGYVQTNNAPDLEDVFALTLDPTMPDHYVFEGRSRPLTRRDVTIEVKQPEGATRTESRTFWDSHLGPVVYRTKDTAFAVTSSRRRAWRYFEGFWRLSRARSFGEFQRVMDLGMIPQSNFTYADAAGNIFYLWNAMLPKRLQDGTTFDLDVPGETAKYAWGPMHPTRDLPRLLNPPGGYVQNANNAPWHTSTRDPLDPARYPKYFEQRELGLRPQMALQLLDGQAKFSVEDVRRLKHETRMLLADRIKPALLAAIGKTAAPSEDLQAARRVLEAWDNRVATGSVGALLFQRFWDRYQAETAQPFEQPWDAARPFETPKGLSEPVGALAHLEEAVRWMRATYGSEAAKWGDVHRFRFGDLDLPADGASGTYGVYRVLSFARADDGTRVAGWPTGAKDLVGSGDAWVLLVHFTRPVQAQSVLAYGQTAHPDSRHGRDQIRLFAEHRLRPVWFTEAQIKANTERAYRP